MSQKHSSILQLTDLAMAGDRQMSTMKKLHKSLLMAGSSVRAKEKTNTQISNIAIRGFSVQDLPFACALGSFAKLEAWPKLETFMLSWGQWRNSKVRIQPETCGLQSQLIATTVNQNRIWHEL